MALSTCKVPNARCFPDICIKYQCASPMAGTVILTNMKYL